MSKVVFRNYDLNAVKQLLKKEIPVERYKCALEDQGLLEQKPISWDGFFFEYDPETKKESLYYRYPSGVVYFIMPVLGYWSVPNEGWVKDRKD